MADAGQSSALRGAVAWLARPSPETAFAIRFATGASLAIWLGHTPGLLENESQWILITVLMVMQPMTGGSLVKGILRLFGTAVAFGTSILLFGFFSQEPPLLLAGLFLVQAVGAYGFTGSRYQYAWFVWAFTTAIVLGDALASGGDVETLAFQRATMVSLGLLIAFVLDTLLWPARAEASLRDSLRNSARQLAAALRKAVATALGTRPPTPEAVPGPTALTGALGLANAARAEPGASRAQLKALTRAALLQQSLASTARNLQRPIDIERLAGHDWTTFGTALEELGNRIDSALEEVAAAIAEEREPVDHAAEVDALLANLDAELQRTQAGAPPIAALDGLVAELRETAVQLHALEQALSTVRTEQSSAPTSRPPRERFKFQFEPDPFRVQIALRASLAVCAAFVLNLALGWKINTLIAPIAFSIAAAPTRGAASQTIFVLAVVVLGSWLLADLLIVFVHPTLGRLPLALVTAFAFAGIAAYASVRRPQLEAVRKFGPLVALLPIFAGPSTPTDVYGSYNTVCYFALAMGVGWAANRFLWPATSATLFRERLAALIALCESALKERGSEADSVERQRRAEEFLTAYTKQIIQVGSFHAQAQHEPIEHALDPARRGALLARMQELFDAVFAAASVGPDVPAAVFERGDNSLTQLREALSRVDAALVASAQGISENLRAQAATGESGLAEAHDAVRALIAKLRSQPDLQPTAEPHERAAFLVHMNARHQLATRLLAIEAWLGDWRGAHASEATSMLRSADRLARGSVS